MSNSDTAVLDHVSDASHTPSSRSALGSRLEQPGVESPAAHYSLARFVVGALLALAIAAAAWPFIPRIYGATAVLVLQPSPLDDQPDSSREMREPLDESAILSQLDQLHSVALADTVIAENHLAEDPEFGRSFGGRLAEAVGSFFKPTEESHAAVAGPSSSLSGPARAEVLRKAFWSKMVVERDRRSYTVRVGMRDSSRDDAARLASSLVHQFMEREVARKKLDLDARRSLLDARITSLKAGADVSAHAVSDFMNRTGLIDGGAGISAEVELRSLSAQLAQAHAASFTARLQQTDLEGFAARGQLGNAPEVMATPIYQDLHNRLAALQGRPGGLLLEEAALRDQMRAEAQRVLQYAKSQATMWSRQEAKLQAKIQSISSRIEERRRAELQLDRLRQTAENDMTVLNETEARRKRLSDSERALKPDAKIISDITVPDRAIFPSPPLYLAGALGMAVLAGAAFNRRPLVRDLRRVVAG